MKNLATFADDNDRAKFAEHTQLARDLRMLRQRDREQSTALEEARRRLEVYEALGAAHTAPPVWKVTAPKRGAKHRGVLCFTLSDVHWSAVIRPEEINGMNVYNLDIAQRRLRYTFESVVKLARNYFAGLDYDGIQVFLPGDMHNGEIHMEMRETNATAITDSITSLMEPLEAGVNLLASEFGTVNVACVVGNHTRRTRKPISKRRVVDNYDYLTYRLLEREFRKRSDVNIHVSPSPDLPVSVYNTKYLLTHGDQFHGGSGIAAELSPLLLGVHRKMRRDAATGAPFDVMVMGHFHHTLFLPSNGLIVCGSVMGYDEFAYLNNLRPERPQSLLWVTTPENGITTNCPVFAEKAKET